MEWFNTIYNWTPGAGLGLILIIWLIGSFIYFLGRDFYLKIESILRFLFNKK